MYDTFRKTGFMTLWCYVLKKHVRQSKIPASECPGADIVAINAMQVAQKMSKPTSMKTFQDFGGRVLSGYGRAHGIMSRGRHYV